MPALSTIAGDQPSLTPAPLTSQPQDLHATAALELDCGRWAALPFEDQATPEELARLLVIRERLVADWQPVGATEQLLVDTLAQTWVLHESWLERLTLVSLGVPRTADATGTWAPPTVSTAEATVLASTMVERLHRTVLRTVRSLQELQRMRRRR